MTAYDLLFIVWFLASAIALITCLILAFSRRRRRTAKRLLLTTVTVGIAYLLVVAASDLAARQRVIEAGHDFCFDEMCFAVVDARTQSLPTSSGDQLLYTITVRVASHSRGRPQAEGGLRARLYQDGQFFNVSETAQQAYDAQHGKTPGLTQKLNPGESVLSVLVFQVPRTISAPGLTLDHGFTPGYFVIGESPFFHQPDIFQLKPGV